MPDPEDKEQAIREITDFLKLPLESIRHDYNECKHLKILLDAQNRKVQCQQCHKILDPFWYLQLLAKEWNLRRYQDSEAIKAYEGIKKYEEQIKAKGKTFVIPSDGEGRNCWLDYEALNGSSPDYVVRSGRYWYAGKGGGITLGDYIKQLLAQKRRNEGNPI